MQSVVARIFDRIIEYSFYAIFVLAPIVVVGDTYELFEFNKMWVVFALTTIIVSSWVCKMIVLKKPAIKRTPLDLFIFLFLTSQVISTIISLDTHVSFWGYYSRFNGGLLSTICYMTLYYAFIANVATRAMVVRLLYITVITGTFVALWGLPSRFGYDPTCFMFRGTLDVACWTEAFKPTVRMFSTMGQPDWFAAYLMILLPILVALFPGIFSKFFPNTDASKNAKSHGFLIVYLLFALLFFADLIFTDARSGFLAFLAVTATFAFLLFLFRLYRLRMAARVGSFFLIPFLVFVFFNGQPFHQLDILTFPGIQAKLTARPEPNFKEAPKTDSNTTAAVAGGTESGDIRVIVWKGALEIWKKHPIIGTGVETFAYAYYKERPLEHNMTSEWDYLYNKAHNEYLNYLATTGILGLGTHLAMIGALYFFVLRRIWKIKKDPTVKTPILLSIGLLSAYTGIIVTNFFNFSVVVINVYFYLIPAWIFILLGILKEETEAAKNEEVTLFQWLFVSVVSLVSIVTLSTLFQYWLADRAYSLGYNLGRANQYDQAYEPLRRAVEKRSNEPVFQDELSINNGILASAYAYQKDEKTASQLANQAITINNKVITEHPNNVVFWKTRVRLFYVLSQIDKKYLADALVAIRRANELAPTDAKISYNMGVLYGQNNMREKATEVLEQTVKLRPNYRDAWLALGLFYREQAVDNNGKVVKPELQAKATAALKHILTDLAPGDGETTETLKQWGEQVD